MSALTLHKTSSFIVMALLHSHHCSHGTLSCTYIWGCKKWGCSWTPIAPLYDGQEKDKSLASQGLWVLLYWFVSGLTSDPAACAEEHVLLTYLCGKSSEVWSLFLFHLWEEQRLKKKLFEILYDSLSWTSLLSCQRKYSSFSSNRRESELDRFWSKLHGIDTEQFFSLPDLL